MNGTKTIVASFSAPPAFCERVRAAAEADERSFSSFVRAALRDYLARQTQEADAA